MNDKLDKLYNSLNYIILGGIVVAYFLFYTLKYDQTFIEIISGWKSIVHIVLVVFANVITIPISFNKGIDDGLDSKTFKDADIKNNEIINYINNNYEKTLSYISMLNKKEREAVDRDFLFNIGKLSLNELDKNELKAYKKLKPKQYSSKGLNLPVYYESNKSNVVSYDASSNLDERKVFAMIKKVFTGLLFALMTVDVVVQFNDMGQAFFSTIILACGMSITYFINYSKPFRRLTKQIPKIVDNKNNFYLGLKEWKYNTQPIIVDEDILRQ